MPPFTGLATDRLQHAVGIWTLTGPAVAGFDVGNLGRRVHGTMPVTSARFEITDNGEICNVQAVLDIAAIDTGLAKRDQDLRKPGLLDLDNHPQLTFRGTHAISAEQGWTVEGVLTVKGTAREITLHVTDEQQPDGCVQVRLIGQLDRRHYGIKAPRIMIGTLVDVEINATFTR